MRIIATTRGVRAEQVVVPFPEPPAESSQDTARLCFDNGLAHVELRAAALGRLLEARFDGPLPVVWADDGNVHVEYPLGSRLLRRARPNSVVLDATVPWALDVHGGAAHLDADLRQVDVRSATFHSGAAHVRLALGRPAAPCTIRLASVSDLVLERPGDVGVRLEVGGGATRVELDGRWFGAVGGGLVEHAGDLGSPDYHVIVNGGADRVTVTGRRPL